MPPKPIPGRTHERPSYGRTKPDYLIHLPWVATTGMSDCPCEYNNGLHAAVHSLLAAMKMDELHHAIAWMEQARDQLNDALRTARKPGASVPIVGQIYDYPEEEEP